MGMQVSLAGPRPDTLRGAQGSCVSALDPLTCGRALLQLAVTASQ
jgi:hypothetical protein